MTAAIAEAAASCRVVRIDALDFTADNGRRRLGPLRAMPKLWSLVESSIPSCRRRRRPNLRQDVQDGNRKSITDAMPSRCFRDFPSLLGSPGDPSFERVRLACVYSSVYM